MRILFVDQQPRTEKSVQPYDIAAIETLLNGYASPGTTVEIGFPDDYEGSQLYEHHRRRRACSTGCIT